MKTYVESLSNHKTSQHNKYSSSMSMDKVFATPLPSEVPIESPERPIRPIHPLLNIPIANLTSVIASQLLEGDLVFECVQGACYLAPRGWHTCS